jgi:hypothetical protein
VTGLAVRLPAPQSGRLLGAPVAACLHLVARDAIGCDQSTSRELREASKFDTRDFRDCHFSSAVDQFTPSMQGVGHGESKSANCRLVQCNKVHARRCNFPCFEGAGRGVVI